MNTAMRASLVLLALAGTAFGQVRAAGGTAAAGVKTPSASAPAGPRIDVRRMALDAFPEITGLDRPKNIQGVRMGISSPPKIRNTRSGFYKGWSWPRIPDLPQVKAGIAYTNRVVSRAEAARNPSGSKVPTAPGRLRPATPQDPEVARRLAELRASPGPETARRLLPYIVEPPVRRTLIGPGAGMEDPRPSQLATMPGAKTTVVHYTNGMVQTTTTAGMSAHGKFTNIPALPFGKPRTVAPRQPERQGRKVITPSFTGTLVAPRGSMLDQLSDHWTDQLYCGPAPTSDRGPLDPRLTDTFTTGVQKDTLVSQEPTTPPEPGAAALRGGDLVAAARELIQHLDENAADARATRTLALVILLREVPESAEKTMTEAYRLDPALAAAPISRDDLPARTDLRQLVIDAVNRANKTGTPQSWLVVGVLMQAQGRGENAARMIARARAAGLDPAIADAFDAQLASQ